MSKDIGMGIRKGAVVSFVPTLFGCFLGIPSLLFLFIFINEFFVTFSEDVCLQQTDGQLGRQTETLPI